MATSSEKAKIYDELLELLKDRMALEQHIRAKGRPDDAITGIRADAYAAVVNLIFGPEALPGIRLSYRHRSQKDQRSP